MKKFALSSLVAGLLMANVAAADSVAVKDGALFTAGNNKLIIEAADPAVPLPATCTKVSHSVPNATEVVVSGDWAHVTSNNAGVVDVTSIDVSSCLVPKTTCNVLPTVDLEHGVLFIPCLDANGKRYDVTMHQRGDSSNWEVDLGSDVHDSQHDDDHGDDHGDDHKH